jgi:hypothetical protein
MTIELEFNPDATPASQTTSNEEPFRYITQYALVVRDVKKVSAFYEPVGLGALPIDHNVSLDRRPAGKI